MTKEASHSTHSNRQVPVPTFPCWYLVLVYVTGVLITNGLGTIFHVSSYNNMTRELWEVVYMFDCKKHLSFTLLCRAYLSSCLQVHPRRGAAGSQLFKRTVKGSVWSKKSFPFFAENMTIRSILNLWWHFEILKLILGVVRGMFTKR